MGLDSYLTATFRFTSKTSEGKAIIKTVGLKDSDCDPNSSLSVNVPVGYWRKASQIHGWMVDHVQNGQDDCGRYYVPSGSLTRLLDLCRQVSKDHKSANALLPVREGFFFGSYEYDEYYFEQIEDTITILSKVVGDAKYINAEFYYYSSW